MIEEMLGIGEAAAKTSQQLSNLLGINRREIMELIRVERLNGAKICASKKGYFLKGNDLELAETVRVLELKSLEMQRAADALKK